MTKKEITSETNKSKYLDIIEDIKLVAATNNIDPKELTKTKYISGGKFSEWEIRKFGGFTSILEDAFGTEEKIVSVTQGQARRKAYVQKLEKIAGDKEYISEQIKEGLSEAFLNSPVVLSNIKPAKINPKKHQRENVVFISDTHFGLHIKKDEVLVNEYSWQIACRRMAKLAEQTATYKQEHREECPQLRICLGGDILNGIIHLSENGTQLITEQIHGSIWILVKFIDYLRHFYSRIIVECTFDNHGRMVHKKGKGESQKYDNFVTAVYTGLQLAFRTTQDVEVHIPLSPITTFKVFNHNFFMTHGDTVIHSANAGRTVNIASITNHVRALQASGVGMDVVLMGHTHTPLNTTLDNRTELIINGTGSGIDPFAQSIGYMNNNPCQILFESIPEYAVGDLRKIYLIDAGGDSRYDEIIPTYSLQGKFLCP